MIMHTIEDLTSGPVRLKLDSIVPAPPDGEIVPYFHFRIHNEAGTTVGHMNFRTGNTRHLLLCAGHIGYGILPEHRGASLSYHACIAIRPFVRSFYHSVILTAAPDNTPSLRVIEKLKAKPLGEITVPKDDPAYAHGARIKLRYEWSL